MRPEAAVNTLLSCRRSLFSLRSYPSVVAAEAVLAGQEGFEPPTSGFGDRRSTSSSYWPTTPLAGLLVHRMLVAVRTKLLVFNPLRMKTLVLHRIVVAVLAITAG